MVNLDTNFYTRRPPFARSVTLLGQRVALRIHPASFTWRFGDGETETSTSPGAAYPALTITHEYLRAGRVRPSVDVTYTAEFRVADGGWQPVPGTATIRGERVDLRVRTATPTLVG